MMLLFSQITITISYWHNSIPREFLFFFFFFYANIPSQYLVTFEEKYEKTKKLIGIQFTSLGKMRMNKCSTFPILTNLYESGPHHFSFHFSVRCDQTILVVVVPWYSQVTAQLMPGPL